MDGLMKSNSLFCSSSGPQTGRKIHKPAARASMIEGLWSRFEHISTAEAGFEKKKKKKTWSEAALSP